MLTPPYDDRAGRSCHYYELGQVILTPTLTLTLALTLTPTPTLTPTLTLNLTLNLNLILTPTLTLTLMLTRTPPSCMRSAGRRSCAWPHVSTLGRALRPAEATPRCAAVKIELP